MISYDQFKTHVEFYFSYLEKEFGMKILDVEVRGNIFYAVRYSNDNCLLSISYENIEDYFNVQLIKIINGQVSDYDDVLNSYRINRLYAIIVPKIDPIELNKNKSHFNFTTNSDIENKILKNARDLRICLKNIKLFYEK